MYVPDMSNMGISAEERQIVYKLLNESYLKALNEFYPKRCYPFFTLLSRQATEFLASQQHIDQLFAELCAYAKCAAEDQKKPRKTQAIHRLLARELFKLCSFPTDISPLVKQHLELFHRKDPENPEALHVEAKEKLHGMRVFLQPNGSSKKREDILQLGFNYAKLEKRIKEQTSQHKSAKSEKKVVDQKNKLPEPEPQYEGALRRFIVKHAAAISANPEVFFEGVTTMQKYDRPSRKSRHKSSAPHGVPPEEGVVEDGPSRRLSKLRRRADEPRFSR